MNSLKRKPGRPVDLQNTKQRKEEILKLAAQFFAEKGYAKTKVEEIAKALLVGKGTIYRYFPTKQALFFATVDQGIRSLNDKMQACRLEPGDALHQIEKGIHSYLEFFEKQPEFVELFIQERAQSPQNRKITYFQYLEGEAHHWQAFFETLQKAKKVRAIPVDRILKVTNYLLYGTIFTNYFNGCLQDPQSQSTDILDILFHGILEKEQ